MPTLRATYVSVLRNQPCLSKQLVPSRILNRTSEIENQSKVRKPVGSFGRSAIFVRRSAFETWPSVQGSTQVMRRASKKNGVTIAAPSQVAADLLTSPGRGPNEAEALIEWMREHEDAWRA